MNTHKGFVALSLLVIGLVIVLGAGAVWWSKKMSMVPVGAVPMSTTTAEVLPETSNPAGDYLSHDLSPDRTGSVEFPQRQLLQDLAGVEPQFVDTQHPLAPTVTEKIKKDIQPLAEKFWTEDAKQGGYAPFDWQYAEIALGSVGRHFVLFYVERPIDCGGLPQLIDAETGKITTIREASALNTPRAEIYIGSTAFYSYAPDTPALVEILGSRIKDNERFHFIADGMCSVSYDFTHTDTSITVSVDRATDKKDEDGNAVYEFARKLTFALPQ